MHLTFLLSLILLTACANRPEIKIASEDPVSFGVVDPKKSRAMLCPFEGNEKLQRFYLELKNPQEEFVDIDLKEFDVRYQNKKQKSSVKRLSQGHYLLEISGKVSDIKILKFRAQGKNLSHKLIAFKKASDSHSSLKVIESADHLLKMNLSLNDEQGKPLITQASPEIILDGAGIVSELQMVQAGVWEFTLSYPEENQIIHLSVRSNGFKLEKLFRYQHVEK